MPSGVGDFLATFGRGEAVGERIGEAAVAAWESQHRKGCPMAVQKKTRPNPGLLTIEEAAAYTALSTKTIRRRIADGALPAFRVGPRSIRVRPEYLEQLLRPIPNARSWR